MSLVYCSTGTACCQQNSPKYAEIFYQDRIVHWFPANCNTLFVRGGSGQEMVLRAIFPARRTHSLILSPQKALRIRSGIRVFHLVAEFKEYLVQCCTRLFFQHLNDFVV